MQTVGIRELSEKASRVVKEVREKKEPIDITYRGRVVARIIPVESEEELRERARRVWQRMDRVAERIGRAWPAGVSAVDAVSEQRR